MQWGWSQMAAKFKFFPASALQRNVILEMRSCELFAWAGPEPQSPDLSLPSG
jgi:hypothetical protein